MPSVSARKTMVPHAVPIGRHAETLSDGSTLVEEKVVIG
jgi:hypothetical protein